MKRILHFAFIAGLFAACTKDKFKTVPQVKITSFGPSEISGGQLIHWVGNVTDKEGDVQDSVIFYRKIFNATSGVLLSTDSSARGTLKDFGIPKVQEYDLQFTLLYGQQDPNKVYEYQPGNSLDRQFAVGVYVKDKAGNRSEYVESEKILLKKI
jgi:hypothetical protein